MKTKIANCAYYQLFVDENKQRLYVELKGFWNDDSVFNSYLSDLKKATTLLDNTFDCHANFSMLKAISRVYFLSYHFDALELLRKHGLRQSGQIMPEDPIACQQLLSIIEKFGKAAVFGEDELLEIYLDSKTSIAA